MTPEPAKEYGRGAFSSLASRIFVAIALLILAGIFMALGACSKVENTVSITGAPGSPTAAGGDSVVTLSWSAVTGATSYKIYWNKKGGVTTSDASIAVTSTSYTHEGLANGSTYYYKISALTSGGAESPLSDEVSATPRQLRPSTPTGLSATSASGKVTLTWQTAERGTSYKVYWNITGSVTSADQRIEAAELSLTHSGLTNGVTYYYRVSAVNDAGESDLSGQISATPSASGGTTSGGGGTTSGGGTAYNSGEWYEFTTSGKTSWGSGTITFSIKGLGYDMLSSSDFFLFMAKLKTSNGSEANFQYNIAGFIPRLISQRFDGTCSKFCEHQDHGSVDWNSAETYSFTFTWNTSAVSLEVKDSSGAVVHSGSVTTDGAYAGVDWIRAGNGVLPPYSGLSSAITVINPVLQ